MTNHVAIGEFSRLTYLSVKTLHHYHDVGLLEPADVDGTTGYRRYALEQVSTAHLIRRLRDLDMPVAEVRDVLSAPDDTVRDARLRAHLARMEAQLERTRDVVASLRELLSPAAPLSVDYRTVAPLPVLAVTDLVTSANCAAWLADAYDRLYAAAKGAGLAVSGPSGATYAREFFEDEVGEVVAFVPVPAEAAALVFTDVEQCDLPGGRFAVTVHAGPFDDFDRTYGALGSQVARDDSGLPDPIRELYVVGADETDDPANYRTDICWPIRPA
jgi:DNA-binding transcriptional MerR regulator/effector-binding domain-containing protein